MLRIVFKIVTIEQNAEELLGNDDRGEAIETAKEDEGTVMVMKDFPQVAASVSRRWRFVAFGVPELWTHIRMDGRRRPQWLERCVALSGSCPLQIQWSRTRPRPGDLWHRRVLDSRGTQPLASHFCCIRGLSINSYAYWTDGTDFQEKILEPIMLS